MYFFNYNLAFKKFLLTGISIYEISAFFSPDYKIFVEKNFSKKLPSPAKPLYVPLFSSKHFFRSSRYMTVSPNTIRPCLFICCFLQSQHFHQLLCIPLVHQLYTTHRPHHRAFCSSRNSYFIFSQTSRFIFI